MSERDERTSGPESAGGEDAMRDRPRTGAAAAARARRIGGRVVGARPTADQPPAQAAETRPSDTAGPSDTPQEKPAESSPNVSVAKADAPAAELPAPPSGTAPLPGWLNWLPAMVLGAGALVMAILLVVFSHGVWWGATPPGKPSAQQVNAARDQVLAAAKSCVATSNTYKYTDIAGYESKALACTTGKVKSQVQTTIQTSIKSLAPKLKHSQTCQINTAGIEKVGADGTWTLLVFGQLESTDTNNPQGVTDPFAAQVQMQQVHGKWLMSGLNEISGQA